MEEELNENELEERFYSMLHYGEETHANINTSQSQEALKAVENAPQSTLRRYWRTNGETNPQNTLNNLYQKINPPNQKVNTPKELPINKTTNKTEPKEEKRDSPVEPLPAHLSLLQSPVPQNLKKTIEIIENDVNRQVVELESSDEDEVIEVALPPKPTITIESSDEDEVTIQVTPTKAVTKPLPEKLGNNRDREVSASPVPSVVSSVSDEFIRGDCIALNISSRHLDDHSFDFSLHGSDLLGQSTPSKRKKKKKNKESATSTPVVAATQDKTATKNTEEYFATPKSKAKKKRQRTKSYSVAVKNIPNPDVYDSDSNHFFIEPNKNHQPYKVTDRSLPNADVYESDSNQSEIVKEIDKSKQNQQSINVESSDSNISVDILEEVPAKSATCNDTIAIVGLTDNSAPFENDVILENIVIGNVTGFTESEDYGEATSPQTEVSKFGSTKVPAILYENLDFDNLKGKDKVCKNRRYSLTTLRAEMEKFYNESWGGEDFNHREIQKNMSRDKSLWAIDPKDRMPSMSRKKVACNYCNRVGHRDDTCRLKPLICYMCGSTGHVEPRCPSKICVNCGSPNYMYSTMCRNCSMWNRISCAECGQLGHPASHCPDLWRRYHNTIDGTAQLEENHYTKKFCQMYCSGCARQGHLIHTCRISLPFSGLPINSPYVRWYRPMIVDSKVTANNQRNKQQHKAIAQDSNISSPAQARNDRNKRLSKSPTTHESHINKKRNTSISDMDVQRNTKSPVNPPQRKLSQTKGQTEDSNKGANEPEKAVTAIVSESIDTEKAPDFIPIGSTNRDKKGQMIQDNEVSDTSAVVTSARIYIPNDIIDKLKSAEGQEWLKQATEEQNVTVENSEVTSFLSIKGNVGDQEAFQTALRDWTKSKPKENSKSDNETDLQETDDNQSPKHNIPKNRNNILRKLNKALDSLKEDLGEPNSIYKELNYLQARHEQLLSQKVISSTQLSNNRDNINEMLKKLNMVLLGQAGLAGGSTHLSELYSLQQRLLNLRNKKISGELRKEIGKHFHCIFTAVPRNDYCELLKSYNGSRPNPVVFKRKKEKALRLNPKKKKFNTIPLQQKVPATKEGKVGGNVVETMNPGARKPLVEKTMNKLVFYHRRLLNARPIDTILKKTRTELVRKLHSHIASLGRSANTSSKTLKKIKKTQAQAQLFLNNV